MEEKNFTLAKRDLPERIVIGVSGHIDSSNAAAFSEELTSLRDSSPEKKVELDLEGLQYISSAGLRVLLNLQKKENGNSKVRLSLVSDNIYKILDSTGFNRIFEVRRIPRDFTLGDAPEINRGGNGVVYRIDEDTILKLYYPNIPYSTVEDEQMTATNALVAGVPAAIAYDTVRCDDRYGVLFEMVKSDTLSKKIMDASPEDVPVWGRKMGAFLKELHTIKADPKEFPSIKDIYIRNIRRLGDLITQEQMERIIGAIRSVPDRETLVHGDFHGRNVMVQEDGSFLLIDLTDLSYGHPAFDLYETCLTAHAGERFIGSIGLNVERAATVWDSLYREYTGIGEDSAITQKEQILGAFSCIRLLDSVAMSARLDDDTRRRVLEKGLELLPHFEKVAPMADAVL